MSLVNRWDENSQEWIVDLNTNEDYHWDSQKNEQGYKKSSIITVVLVVVVVVVAIVTFLATQFAVFGNLYIDNPTDTEVTVQIWDKEVLTLAPKSHQEIELKTWTYSLVVNGESVWEFKKLWIGKSAFLNPTKSVYIEEKAVYVTDWVDIDDDDYKEIEIDWQIFYWPFEVYDDYYVVWNWSYGLDEVLPDEVETYSDSAVKIKIYRYDEFVEMYDEYYYDYLFEDFVDEEGLIIE